MRLSEAAAIIETIARHPLMAVRNAAHGIVAVLGNENSNTSFIISHHELEEAYSPQMILEHRAKEADALLDRHLETHCVA